MDNSKTIDWVIDLSDDDFKDLVSQSMRAHKTQPEKWQLLLDERLIDATRDVIEGYLEDAAEQMKNPARFPRAKGFHTAVRAFLLDLEFTDRLRGEG